MRCLIDDCFHTTRNPNKSTCWNDFQICPCCMKSFIKLNGFHSDTSYLPASGRCRIGHKNKYEKPLTSLILSILTKPESFESIRTLIRKKYSITVPLIEIKHSSSQLLIKRKISKNNSLLSVVLDK